MVVGCSRLVNCGENNFLFTLQKFKKVIAGPPYGHFNYCISHSSGRYTLVY